MKVYAVASEVHGKDYYLPVFERLRSELERRGIRVHDKPLTSSLALRSSLKSELKGLVGILFLTGGTVSYTHLTLPTN